MNEKNMFYFQWHFIKKCNLRCIHCYQGSYGTSKLTKKDIIKIAENLDLTLAKWKKQGRISLTGGEPFIDKDLLLRLLNFFNKSKNIYWLGILTNGTLIDNEIVNEISKYQKLKEIQISIDGASSISHDKIRGKGSFDKAINGIKLLKQNGFYVSIMCTLHNKNKDEVISVIDLAQLLDVNAITIERLTPIGKADIDSFLIDNQELKSIYNTIYMKKRIVERSCKSCNLNIRVSRPLWSLIDSNIGGFCPAGFTSLTILHDGTVLPCRRIEIPIGNVLKDGLFKIWYQSDVLWQLRNKNLLEGKCNKCRFLSSCGGCRAIAYAVNKNIMAEDPQCWL